MDALNELIEILRNPSVSVLDQHNHGYYMIISEYFVIGI